MADVFPHNREALALHPHLDRRADLTHTDARTRGPDPSLQRLSGNVHQPPSLFRDGPRAHSHRGIGDESLVRAAQVNADDVAIHDLAVARYSVHDLIVH